MTNAIATLEIARDNANENRRVAEQRYGDPKGTDQDRADAEAEILDLTIRAEEYDRAIEILHKIDAVQGNEVRRWRNGYCALRDAAIRQGMTLSEP